MPVGISSSFYANTRGYRRIILTRQADARGYSRRRGLYDMGWAFRPIHASMPPPDMKADVATGVEGNDTIPPGRLNVELMPYHGMKKRGTPPS